ncbi:single-strand binding protein/Primosomal replication protein n [Microbacterium esteraromaticum]|uniref:Single-strand binding protein/Primosomal replication protein n n=1 Tax=Microbacterium esteraromaticum TaxID=57043 RepID=A0A1R4I6W0_9MICO|nr:single-strand binding protein/Primosomal replication protein n [Microbacterium esteraromaticum]
MSGFIASTPQLTFSERGGARFYAKIGQEHYRKEEDGSFTQTETTFHDLVSFRKTAERAHARFAKGDKFVAEGYTHEYDHIDADGQAVPTEEFIAKKIGHDLARTNYEVTRARRSQPAVTQDAPEQDQSRRANAATSSVPTL